LKLAVVGAAAGVAVIGLNSFTPEGIEFFNSMTVEDTEFMNFVTKFRRSYGTKEEYSFRAKVFKANLAKIAAINSQNGNLFTVGVNQFADWTETEYKKLLGYKAGKKNPKNIVNLKVTDLPASVDWRTAGAVTPVKNQQQCGSCWSFSATGSMEGAHFLKTGQLVSLSEQQLVDCSGPQGNMGCNGGWMDQAFTYAQSNKMETEADYPYVAYQ
jgi:cathepsin L